MLATLTALCAGTPVHAEYSDCRTCHYATSIDGTPDLSPYFAIEGHHPVRVSYPLHADYHQPGGSLSGILFFDRNGNGLPDPDEIQIFSSTTTTTTTTTKTRGSKGGKTTTVDTTTWVIDCASCHIEHGTTVTDPRHAADYVRGAGGERWLCLTCHNL